MTDPSRPDLRFLLERAGLTLLGPLALLAVSPLGPLVGPFVALGLSFGAAAVVAGLVEAASVRRKGRRYPIGAWLPTIVGALAFGAVLVATGPQGPDSGVALGVMLAAAVVITPLFALAVTAVVALALRLRPSAHPHTL